MINRRQLNLGFVSTAAVGLSGCSAGGLQLAQPQSSDIATQENVVLNTDGTPKLKDLMKAGPLGDKSLGRADAPVTMIKYASLTCPYCREFHIKTFPQFKSRYIDTGKVRFILREFPIGHTSGAATIVMRCGGQQNTERYFALYHQFMVHQKQWVSLKIRHDAIYKVAAKTGLSKVEFDSCKENQKIVEGLQWVKQRGRKLGVSGTPTFFINGKKYRSVLTLKQIEEMIAPYLA